MDASGAAILTAVIYSVVLPAGLLVWWRRRTGERLWCFLAGAICFSLFALVLEPLLHVVCLVGDNAVSRALNASTLAYTLYGALAAGVFEETGRVFGYKLLLKNHSEKACAVAYGIGHGGMEAVMILGATYLVYFLAKCGVQMGEGEAAEQLVSAANAVGAGTACAAMLERLSAMLAHIGLSMIVFVGVRRRGMLRLYPAAIALHALLDTPAALYQRGVLTSLWVVEGALLLLSAAYLFIGKKLLDGYEAP